MASTEEILLRIRGRDQTGEAFSSVEGKANQMKSVVSNAVGMAAGMIGYDLVNGMVEAGRSAINSAQQLDYFGGRLNMSAQETDKFRGQIDDLQREFRKVDMTAVGATAEEIAVKMDLPKEKVGDLTKMTAVLSSTFVKEGRSQEDAVLAVGDALDGQFKRLQEIGITQDKLKENGWNGNIEDQASLIDALNKSMSEMGYEQTAKDITNLDEAWNALTITGGKLLADIVLPLAPAVIGIADAIMNTLDFIKDNGWVQGALLITGLAIGFGLLAGALSIAAAAEGGLMTLMPGFITSLYGAASGFMAISIAGAPLWLIVAALAAVALAVYEVGIYFGWWTDVGSMLQAISAGVQRLWSAFINNENVKGTIQDVQNAINALWDFLQPAISWIQEQWTNLFGKPGSNVDAVRMLIDTFGTLGKIAGDVVNTVKGLFSGNIPIEQFGLRVLNGIVGVIMFIPNRIAGILNQVVSRILVFGNIAFIRARLAGQRILNGILAFIRSIPGRVFSFFMQIPGRIANAAGSAASAARNLGSQAVQGVISQVTGIPDKVHQEFLGIAQKVIDVGGQLYNAAKDAASQLWEGFNSILDQHSPGIFMRAIDWEFKGISDMIANNNANAYSAARRYAGNMQLGFNAPQMTLPTLGAVRQNANYVPSTTTNSNITMIHVHEGAVPVDARNMTDKEAQGVVIAAFESIGKAAPGGG